MVAGTGHDFLNRHSCEDGLFIRTSLIKENTWTLDSSNRFDWPDGFVRLGAGMVFSEIHDYAA